MDTPLQHHSNYGDLLEILVYLGRYVQESFPVEQKSLRAHCKYNVSSFLVEMGSYLAGQRLLFQSAFMGYINVDDR